MAELPQLPMLAIKALKQLEKGAEGQKIAKQQTDIIVKQLKENAAKQSDVIVAGTLIILSGILITQSLWLYASASGAAGVLFWLKSR
jgi:ubiquinone biosynthesis protein